MENGERVTQAVAKAEQRRQRKEKKQEVSASDGQQPKEADKQEKQEVQETQETGKDIKDTAQNDSGSVKSSEILGMTVKRAAVFLFAIVGIYLLLWYRRKWILKKRWERFSQENRTQSVREIAKELGVLLRLMGQRRRIGMSDRDYQTVLEEKLPDINWQQVFALFQKAAFSQDDMKEEEYRETLSICQELGQRITQKRGVKGWFLKYIFIYP